MMFGNVIFDNMISREASNGGGTSGGVRACMHVRITNKLSKAGYQSSGATG